MNASAEVLRTFWQGMALHLWQTTLALVVVLVLARLLSRAPAKLHSRLWLAGLLKFFLPLPLLAPLTAWLLGQFGRAESITEVTVVRTAWEAAWIVVEPWAQSPTSAIGAAGASSAPYLLLTLLWLMLSLALAYFWWSRSRRRGDLLPAGSVGSGLRRKVAATAENVGLPAERVYLTDSEVMPCVLGLRRATLVLPRRAAEQLDPAELHAIFAHETAHMRRWDVARAALERAAILVFFFYPPLWLVIRRLNQSAELACDELVLDSGLSAETYVTALAKTLRLGLFPHYVPAVSGGGPSLIAERLQRIRQPGRYIGMFRHKVAVLVGFFVVAALSLLPIADLDKAAAETRLLPAGRELSSPAPQGSQDPVRVGAGESQEAPEITRRVEPSYPDEAKRARAQGAVVVEVIVNEEGLVQEARVVEGVEDAPKLGEAAVDAIRQWEFKPTVVDGIAVKVQFVITVRFRLE